MRILVTGAAGYIGSALVRALAAHEVVATDQSAPATLIGNIAYPQFARSLITPDIDVVFHLASLVSGGAEQNFELGTKVNLDATRDLLAARRRWRGRAAATPRFRAGRAPGATGHAHGLPARLGFSHSVNIEEIVREYEEAALAHHG